MKKKLLMFLLILCCVLPCFVFMTACGATNNQGQNQSNNQEQNPSGDQGQNPGNGQGQGSSGDQGQGSSSDQESVNYSILLNGENSIEDFAITQVEANDYNQPLYSHELKEGTEYLVWVGDFYKINSVQIYFDDEPLTMTYCQTKNQNSRIITSDRRKEAKFTVPDNLSGDHVIKCVAQEEEYAVKFVSDGQSFTDEEKNVLSNFCLPGIEGRDFLSLMDSNESLVVKYSDFSKGIPFTSKKAVGWYSYSIFAMPNAYSLSNDDIHYEYVGGANHNEFLMGIDTYSGFQCDGGEQSIFELTFNKYELTPSMLGVNSQDSSNPNLGQIISLSVDGAYWSVNKETATRVYIEPYTGVDLSNVEAYIFDVKMELNVDADNGKKYFEIPAGKVPVDYFYGTVETFISYKCTDFPIRLENVDVTGSDLLTQFNVSSNNNSVECVNPIWFVFYCRINGVTYFKPAYRNAQFNIEDVSELPSSIKLNGVSFDLSSYVVFDSSVPIGAKEDGKPSWRYSDGFDGWCVYHKIQIGTEDVLLELNFDGNKKLTRLVVHFDVKVNTTVELVY